MAKASDRAAVRAIVAAHLRPLIEAVGIQQLAGRLGISRPTVYQWIDGKALPGVEQWEPLAAALGLDRWHGIFPSSLDAAKILEDSAS